MKTYQLKLLLLVASLVASGAANPEFDRWADRFAADWAHSNPQFATRTQYFSGAEQDELERRLTLGDSWGSAIGHAEAVARAEAARLGLDELRRFPLAGLAPIQRASAALLESSLRKTIADANFTRHFFVFDQFRGLQVELVNFLTQIHPIRRLRDVENYLARLELVAPRLDEGLAEARAAAEADIMPPRFIMERTIEQLDGMLLHAARENVFVSSLGSRMAALGTTLPSTKRDAAAAAAERIVEEAVLPAIRRVRALLVEQLPRTNDDAGVWRLPRGAEFYQHALSTYTTTALTAEEVHAIGLREVARLEGEMDAILRSLGYRDGTVNARFAQLNATLQPPVSPDPRPQILAESERWVRDAERRCAALFDLRPSAPVEVKREPPFSERTTAAHYSPPAPDGSKAGTFWLPLPGPTFNMLGIRSLAHHEAVPGHHFQIALQMESTLLPRFRQMMVFGVSSAAAEGWALYAQHIADENGWYESDPHGRLGFLRSILFRARRLVVDTGLHAKKWTRQQVIDYGIPMSEAERYVVWPGQACSYMIGYLRVLEMRNNAKAALGAKFSIKGFHNVLLSTGNVPLDVLAQEVDAWVKTRR